MILCFLFPILKRNQDASTWRGFGLLDDSPIFYDISYIANINLPRITARKFENRSLFQILRDNYRVEIKGGDQRIKAIPASQKISRFLQLKKEQPVLHLERKMETNKTGLFLYSSIFCNTEQILNISGDFNIPDVGDHWMIYYISYSYSKKSAINWKKSYFYDL